MSVVENLTLAEKWDLLFQYLGIKEYVNFISSPELQWALLPVKIVFILFTVFFFAAVIYFYRNSSYLKYKFMQDVSEFISWQPYGLKSINKRWQKIVKGIEGGTESDYKIAIISADDFLYKILEDSGYVGETFEELLNNAKNKILPSYEDISFAHSIRDSIVYNPDYKLDIETAKKILADYEKAVKNL